MPFEIPQEIRERTTACEKEFSCLTGEREDVCKVTGRVADDLLFVDFTGKRCCQYVLFLGDDHLCRCPTRQEIYRRYRE